MEEEKVMEEEAKREKRKIWWMEGQNSAPTLWTQHVAKSTQSNWDDSVNSKKKKNSFLFICFPTPKKLHPKKKREEKNKIK